MKKTGQWMLAMVLWGCLVSQVGCETKDTVPLIRFQAYELSGEPKEVVPEEAQILIFSGLKIPCYPFPFFMQQPAIKELPFRGPMEVEWKALLETPDYWDETFIVFKGYWPINLSPVIRMLNSDRGRDIGDLEAPRYDDHERLHLILPLIPKGDVSLPEEESAASLIINGRAYPFLFLEGRGSWMLVSSTFGTRPLFPDILPLNLYFNEYPYSEELIFDLAYPKVAPPQNAKENTP